MSNHLLSIAVKYDIEYLFFRLRSRTGVSVGMGMVDLGQVFSFKISSKLSTFGVGKSYVKRTVSL